MESPRNTPSSPEEANELELREKHRHPPNLLQRLMDYRNRAEELRVMADEMREGPARLMRSAAGDYDLAAQSLEAALVTSD